MDIEKNNLIKWLFVWSFTGQLPVSKRQTVHSLLNSGEVATHAQFRSISLCSSQRATQVKPEAAGVAQVIAGQRRGLRFLEPTCQRFSLLCLTLAQTDGFHFDFISFRCDLSTGNLKDPWVFFILLLFIIICFKGSLGYLNLQSSSRMALCFPGFRLQSQVAESCKSPQERVPTATVMLVFLKGLTGPRS